MICLLLWGWLLYHGDVYKIESWDQDRVFNIAIAQQPTNNDDLWSMVHSLPVEITAWAGYHRLSAELVS